MSLYYYAAPYSTENSKPSLRENGICNYFRTCDFTFGYQREIYTLTPIHHYLCGSSSVSAIVMSLLNIWSCCPLTILHPYF